MQRAELRIRCRDALAGIGKRCAAGSLPACDAAMNAGESVAAEACKAGSARACQQLAGRTARDSLKLGANDPALSAQLAEDACLKGSTPACEQLSEILAEGRGVPQDARRALALHDDAMAKIHQAVEKCDTADCSALQPLLGILVEKVDPNRRADLAPAEVAKECEAGGLSACQGLRGAYSGGSAHLVADSSKASVYGLKANQLLGQQCARNDQSACDELVRSLLYVAPMDVARGRQLADAACSRGSYQNCWLLADFLAHDAATREPAAANTYYARAVGLASPKCDGGDDAACSLMAQAYALGRGVARDTKKSAEYLIKANKRH